MHSFKTYLSENVLSKLEGLRRTLTDILMEISTITGDMAMTKRKAALKDAEPMIARAINSEIERFSKTRDIEKITFQFAERLSGGRGLFNPTTRVLTVQIDTFFTADEIPGYVGTFLHEFIHAIQPFLTPEAIRSEYNVNAGNFVKQYLGRIESMPTTISILSALLAEPKVVENPGLILRYIDAQMKDQLDDSKPSALSYIGEYFEKWMEVNDITGHDLSSRFASALGQIRHLIAGGRNRPETRSMAMKFGLKLKDVFAREVTKRRVK